MNSESVSHSVVSNSVTPWTVACQVPLPMEFSRQEYWHGLPFPSPGDFPIPGIKPGSLALKADLILSEPPGKPIWWGVTHKDANVKLWGKVYYSVGQNIVVNLSFFRTGDHWCLRCITLLGSRGKKNFFSWIFIVHSEWKAPCQALRKIQMKDSISSCLFCHGSRLRHRNTSYLARQFFFLIYTTFDAQSIMRIEEIH